MLSSLCIRVKQWTAFAVATPVYLTPAMILAPFINGQYSHILFVKWSETMIKALDLTVNVDNRSGVANVSADTPKNVNKRGVLYIHLNQQTLMACMLYNLMLPHVKLVVNAEFAMLPFIGWTCMTLGAVPIFRQFPKSAKIQLEKAISGLKSGEDYGISIEGKRTEDGNLSEFKKGPIVMAIEAQCDIVPFMTHGEYPLWPRGTYSVKPHGKIDCVLYPKISTTGLTYADREVLLKQLRDLAESEKKLWEESNSDYLNHLS